MAKGDKAFDRVDVDVRREGKEIILPAEPSPMTLPAAIKMLERKQEEEETIVSFSETIPAFPWDGAVAFMEAMRRTYGWTQAVPTMTFFGPKAPAMLTVEDGPNHNRQVVWGSFKLPFFEDAQSSLETGATERNGMLQFAIRGQIRRKYNAEVKALADLTRKIAKEESIYKGHAFRMRVDSDGNLSMDQPPAFMDTSSTNPEELIFSRSVEAQIRTNLFTPIEHTAACKAHGIPLSRGVLLEGPFGTGKTMTAAAVAAKCEANGWTFITIDRVSVLKTALDFAALYAPAVVFAEDIDRVMSGDRTEELDDILNIIDGVSSKSKPIITILTSNEVEKINRAMLRPGRLDAVIRVSPPDAEAVERLMRLYGRGLIAADEDLSHAAKAMSGSIPAVVREAVERAKLYAISNTGDATALHADDLTQAADGMAQHLALLNRQDAKKTDGEILGETLRKVLVNGREELETTMAKQVGEIHQRVTD